MRRKPTPMTLMEALEHAQALQEEWVGKGAVDLDRIQSSMRKEYTYAMKNPKKRTPENLKDTMYKMVLLGKVKKALART